MADAVIAYGLFVFDSTITDVNVSQNACKLTAKQATSVIDGRWHLISFLAVLTIKENGIATSRHAVEKTTDQRAG